MSEYRYYMTMTGADRRDLDSVLEIMKKEWVYPNLLDVDHRLSPSQNPNRLWTIYMSTENVTPNGTVGCWDSADHETFFHDLSLKFSGLMFKLTGENLDDPNNGVFVKAFHNGMYKAVYQEKQDIDWQLEEASWHMFGATEAEKNEGEAYLLFEQLKAQRSKPGYSIASDMAYMHEKIGMDTPLTPGQLYTLASKLNEFCAGSSFLEPLLHEEHLDAIRYMLENGLVPAHTPEFPKLSPEDTLTLLLNADKDVFGTLVETVAIHNRDLHFVLNQDIDRTVSEINAQQNKKPSLDQQIAGAEGKAQQAEQGRGPQQPAR